MRDSIKDAIASTVNDMIQSDLPVSFTKKELNSMGVDVPDVFVSVEAIQKIRKTLNVSQLVFAKLLNVSLSSVRQWEQGVRKPSGSTMILLELLQREPKLLDYRIQVA